MPAYTLAQAIAATGRSRSALIRAIRSGKLSASRDESGAYLVDLSELQRVYPDVPSGSPADTPIDVPRHADLPPGSPLNRPEMPCCRMLLPTFAAVSTPRPSSSARRCSRCGC